MELGLTLGEAPPPKPFSFLAEKRCSSSRGAAAAKLTGLGLGFCMSLGGRRGMGEEELEEEEEGEDPNGGSAEEGSPAFPLQLDLLPFHPVPRSQLPWPSDQGISDRCFDVNRLPSAEEQEDGVHSQPISSSSSPASAAEAERASSRASDEEENGLSRKKLRLSREQSAFLEESFKEHNTLNPKQKLALAKQLNLRPRQVEVWFQNRRARTKLKQTEVDCEHLKRCCERLTEENRRLQKELQELRALKTSHPFYMHLPATTLTMCPSCERVASTTSATAPVAPTAPVASEGLPRSSSSPSTRPVFFPFGPHQGQSSAGS